LIKLRERWCHNSVIKPKYRVRKFLFSPAISMQSISSDFKMITLINTNTARNWMKIEFCCMCAVLLNAITRVAWADLLIAARMSLSQGSLITWVISSNLNQCKILQWQNKGFFKILPFRHIYETHVESCLVGPYLRPELSKASSTDAKMALFILLHDFASSYYCNALFILFDSCRISVFNLELELFFV
jgi:hypothetical protein